jgi:hypothetical protein
MVPDFQIHSVPVADVWYFYKSCRQYLKHGKLPVRCVHVGKNLRVMTMGMNDVSEKGELRRHQFQDA